MTLPKFSSKEELLEFCQTTPLADIPLDVARSAGFSNDAEVNAVLYERCKGSDPELCVWVEAMRQRFITDEEAQEFGRMFSAVLPIVAVTTWMYLAFRCSDDHVTPNLKRIHPFVKEKILQSACVSYQDKKNTKTKNDRWPYKAQIGGLAGPTGPSGATGSSS